MGSVGSASPKSASSQRVSFEGITNLSNEDFAYELKRLRGVLNGISTSNQIWKCNDFLANRTQMETPHLNAWIDYQSSFKGEDGRQYIKKLLAELGIFRTLRQTSTFLLGGEIVNTKTHNQLTHIVQYWVYLTLHGYTVGESRALNDGDTQISSGCRVAYSLRDYLSKWKKDNAVTVWDYDSLSTLRLHLYQETKSCMQPPLPSKSRTCKREASGDNCRPPTPKRKKVPSTRSLNGISSSKSMIEILKAESEERNKELHVIKVKVTEMQAAHKSAHDTWNQLGKTLTQWLGKKMSVFSGDLTTEKVKAAADTCEKWGQQAKTKILKEFDGVSEGDMPPKQETLSEAQARLVEAQDAYDKAVYNYKTQLEQESQMKRDNQTWGDED